jgi:hypothetical protein
MTLTTSDRAKIGTTTYIARVGNWFNDEPVTKTEAELPTFAAAKTWVREHRTDGYYANIDRGTYTADDIDDDEYGTICHASREVDPDWGCYGEWSPPKGRIQWEPWGS